MSNTVLDKKSTEYLQQFLRDSFGSVRAVKLFNTLTNDEDDNLVKETLINKYLQIANDCLRPSLWL